MSATDNPMKDKICLVCGDKALGYNFNAVTCESCKAFFRRNALRDKQFKCPFNEKCEINTVTRRFCQHCRLIKCFTIGMKKEYIMTDAEKLDKREKIRNKKVLGESSGEDDVAPKRTKSTVSEDSMHSVSSCAYSEKSSKGEGSLMQAVSGNSFSGRLSRSGMYENDRCHFARDPGASSSRSISPDISLDQRRKDCLLVPNSVPDVPSPSMVQPSSPVGSASVRSVRSMGSNQSRSVEIYQMSKAFDTGRNSTNAPSCQPNVLRNILCSDSLEPAQEGSSGGLSHERKMPLLVSLMDTGSSSRQQERSFRSELADEVFSDIPKHFQMGHSIDSILTEAIKLEYEAYSSMNPRISSRELNDAERAKLNELIVANKALLAPLEDDDTCGMAQAMSKEKLGGMPMLVDVLNLTAVAIRRLIKMSKKVNAFKNMCQEDQVALLKGGCTEMMILRSAMTYDSDRGSWKIPHSAEKPMNIKVDVLKEAGGRVFEEHQRFLQTFDQRWRKDENIMLILSAITLFTPHRPRVVHHDVIKLEQNSYYYLLRRYLESTYAGCEARSTFLQLIQKISELHRLNEDHVRVYMDLNPEDVEPLLIEIFDLKHTLDS